VNGNGLTRSQPLLNRGNQIGKFHSVFWNAAIRNRKRDKSKIGTLAERLLIGDIKRPNLMRLQQRYDCLNAQTIPPGNVVGEPLSAARARHYGEAHPIEFAQPINVWLNHLEIAEGKVGGYTKSRADS
jgi:ABC-type phosphonate transport system ATPase subunit